jgi:deoxycytidylate deaminase
MGSVPYDPYDPYTFGYNKYEMTLNHGTIHAEVDAMLKLPYQKKVKRINLAVFTTNRDGTTLRTSKCCQNCLKSIDIIAKRKNYIVNRIYYINEEGNLKLI